MALKPLPEPRAEMLRYTAVLRQLVAEMKALVRAQLIPQLPQLVADAGRFTAERTDDASDTIARIIEAVRQALGLSEAKARRWAMEMLERVQRGHAQKFVDAYEGRLAVNPLAGAEPWVRDQMAVAVKENARLITSLPEQMLAQVEGVVNRGVLAGKRHEDLARLISDRLDVAESRAALIARDQVLKWHGSLTRLRQVDAGITEYEWSTSRDERVRPSHRARDGKRFQWTESPKPGEEVNCRCAAIPVIPDDEPVLPVTPPTVRPAPPAHPFDSGVVRSTKRGEQWFFIPADPAHPGTVDTPGLLGRARISLADDPELATVQFINAASRGKGTGTRLYAEMADYAEEHGRRLASDIADLRTEFANAWWERRVREGIAVYDSAKGRYILTGRLPQQRPRRLI